MTRRPRPLLRLVAVALLGVAVLGTSLAQQALRPEVGKPLQQAGELLRAGKAREALAKVAEADKVPNKTAQEQMTIERMRGAAAQRAGDSATAIRAFEAVMASGTLKGAEAAQVAESLAFAYSQQRNWPKTTEWANRAQELGSTSPQLRQLITYVQSQTGDYASIGREAQAAITAAEQAGRRPAEDDLLRLADAQQRTNNTAGYLATFEKLLTHYPKKEYWNAYLARVMRKPGFADRLGLDVMRLKLATGNLTGADEYMEMAQLALQAGLPAEGRRIVERGIAAGVLGTGAEAARHQRLLDLAVKQEGEVSAGLEKATADALAAKDGNALVQVGQVLVSMGQAERGAQLIEQGIAKGGLRRPDDAKLRLGQALLATGKNKPKALQTLRGVQGADGTADIARLVAIQAGQTG
jgi:tetratricopeptide (TPR) repeat protein